MGFSALRAINEDIITPGEGFGTHPYKDMDILTYVLSGTVAHRDSMGNQAQIHAGEFQIMSAGTGIRHSEYNARDELLHLYQIWILPSFAVCVWTSLVPVVLMALRAITEMLLPAGNPILAYTEFFGDSIMATLIAVLIAIFTFSLNRDRSIDDVMGTITDSIKIIARCC